MVNTIAEDVKAKRRMENRLEVTKASTLFIKILEVYGENVKS